MDGRHRLYGDLAHLWSLMRPPDHYVELGGGPLLAARTGADATGPRQASHPRPGYRWRSPPEHHLTAAFDATAVTTFRQFNEAMLSHSRRLNPGVVHHIGDMPDRTSKHSRLGENLRSTPSSTPRSARHRRPYIKDGSLRGGPTCWTSVFATANRAHPRPGGGPGRPADRPPHWGARRDVPTTTPTLFEPPHIEYQTNRDANTELTYVEYSTDLDPNDTTVETTYVFFFDRAGELQVEVDRHTTGLFPVATWERLLTQAGFEVDRVDYPVSSDGRGMWLWLWVGRLGGGS